MGCERIIISATMTSDAVSDCTAAAYPKYSLTPAETVPMPSFLNLVNDCTGCGAPEPIVSDDYQKYLEVTILSAGGEEMDLGHRPYIEIDGVRFDDRSRGFLIITVDALTGAVTHQMTFNTNGQTEADVAMANFIRHDIPQNSIVLITTRHSSSRYARECLTALKEIGAQEAVQTDQGDNFAMVGFKGTVWPSWIQQVNLPSGQGPAQIYTKIPLMG
ncbi:cell surface hyaluronidase-like [Branchiostoma lanceolatum]|uniref:cell surface hyaluronidase-like n=1 Tax=Branchiostoma lanceolatum TaxID=7740 RepID=UPI0034516EC7